MHNAAIPCFGVSFISYIISYFVLKTDKTLAGYLWQFMNALHNAALPSFGVSFISYLIIIIYNFCMALFSGIPKLTELYNILQHFLSFTNIIHIIMTTNNV